MNNTKRFLTALVFSAAALSVSGVAQADGPGVTRLTEETEAYDHHLTLSDKYNLEFYWSK